MRIAKFAATVAAAGLGSIAVQAEDPRRRIDLDRDLAQQLYREFQERQECKARICEVVRSKKMQGENVACKVLKTWPAADLKRSILKNRFEWSWGNARCEANLVLDRAQILAAAYLSRHVAKVGKHDIECRLEAKDSRESETVKFTIEPIVTFEGAKAVRAALQWGNLSGPAVIKVALWSASTVDNTFSVLEQPLLEQINDFFGPKCAAATPVEQPRRP